MEKRRDDPACFTSVRFDPAVAGLVARVIRAQPPYFFPNPFLEIP
jgi:hypothetical protein